jgi:hypothetical protein
MSALPDPSVQETQPFAVPLAPDQVQALVRTLPFGQLVADLCFVGLQLQGHPSAAQQHWYDQLIREIARRST